MKLNEIFDTNSVKKAFYEKIKDKSYSPIVALTETALENNMNISDTLTMLEVAPPGENAENWIKTVKSDFKKRYGDEWQRVLYATAWKKFGESIVTESTTKELLVTELSSYPDEIVDHFRDDETFTGFISDNKLIGRIVKKLMDTTNLKAGPIMRVAEHIKEYNRVNGASSLGNSDKARKDARSDRILRIRDSSGKATARKF